MDFVKVPTDSLQAQRDALVSLVATMDLGPERSTLWGFVVKIEHELYLRGALF